MKEITREQIDALIARGISLGKVTECVEWNGWCVTVASRLLEAAQELEKGLPFRPVRLILFHTSWERNSPAFVCDGTADGVAAAALNYLNRAAEDPKGEQLKLGLDSFTGKDNE